VSAPRWVEETLHHRGAAQRLLAERVLVEERGGLQDMLVFDNPVFGRTLMLDGVVQTTERDEFVYHEMLAHVPLFAHGAARRVLVVGGGDGGTLEEVLKHRTVERATLVEIDARVIAASREHLGAIHRGAFDDPRTRIVIGDGVGFVRDADELFDAIIVDSTDPAGPGSALVTTEFYRHCRARLAEGGILVAQGGVPFLQPEGLRRIAARLGAVFADVAAYAAAVPTYYGGLMAFAWACDDPGKRAPERAELERRFAAAGVETRCYAPDLHLAAFALPRFMRALLAAGE
jgi:spermidine synthase